MLLHTLAVAALAAGPVLGQTPTPPPPAPPVSVAQICAATGLTEVDALLEQLVENDLVGSLSPLLGITVPDADSLELDAAVDLGDIRQALDCDENLPPTTTEPPPTTTEPPPTTTEPPPTTTEPPAVPLYDSCQEAREAGAAPMEVGEPGYREEFDPDRDGLACEGAREGKRQVDVVPNGAPETGGQPPHHPTPGALLGLLGTLAAAAGVTLRLRRA